jgi:hypothetical protein
MMREPTLIPASLDVAERNVVTHGQWLCGEMEARGITNLELFRRMSRLGYTGQSSNIVSVWRGDGCKIALDTLPWLLGALGMDEDERRAWVVHFTCATYPALAPYLQVAA